jgi:DNA-directed RNA polymerase omega subunit
VHDKKWLYVLAFCNYNTKFKFCKGRRFTMARITIENALKLGFNKFELVHLATRRVVELRKGKEVLIPTSNKEIVAALREIEGERVILRESAYGLPDGLTSALTPVENLLVEETAVDESAEDSEGSEEPEEAPDVQDEETVDET